METLSRKLFDSLDAASCISIFSRFPEIALHGDKAKKLVTATEMDQIFGIDHLDYLHNKFLLNFYRLKSRELYVKLRSDLRPADTYTSMVCARVIRKFRFGECGESVQLLRYKFCKNQSIDGVLLSLVLYHSAEKSINHALSLFIPRETKDAVLVFKKLLIQRSSIISLPDIKEILPGAILIDVFFRETDLLLNYSNCKSLCSYISKSKLDSMRLLDITDPQKPDFTTSFIKAKSCAHLILREMDPSVLKSEYRLDVGLWAVHQLYQCKQDCLAELISKRIMREFPWRRSGSHLMLTQPKETIARVVEFFREFKFDGGKLEYTDFPSRQDDLQQFFIVNLHPTKLPSHDLS